MIQLVQLLSPQDRKCVSICMDTLLTHGDAQGASLLAGSLGGVPQLFFCQLC